MQKSKDSLESRLRKIESNRPTIAKAIEEDPNLRNQLVSSYKKAAVDGKGLKYAGKFIDYINKPLALIKTIGAFAGPGTGYLIRGLTKIGQVLFMKLPYSIYYSAKGGAKKVVAGLGALEAVKYLLPFG